LDLFLYWLSSRAVHRGVALIDWRSGLLAYVEADDAALEEFRKIVELCGGALEPRSLPCMTSLASRLKVKSVLYITDIYGIANSVAFEKKTARTPLLEEAWAYIDSLICGGGEVECGEDVVLSCCRQCDLVCLLAKVLGLAKVGVKVDLRGEIKRRLTG